MVRGTHKNAFREYVTSKAAGLSALLADPLLGEVKAALVDGAPLVGNFQVHGTWPAFLQEALRTCSGNPELHSVVMALLEKEQSSASSATHHEKRRLLRGLGLLGTSGYSVGKILAESPSFDAAAAVLKARGIKLIARSRRTASDLGYKRGYQLVEDPAYMTAKSILCTEDGGFYVIPPGESAVFVSGTGTETVTPTLYLNRVSHENLQTPCEAILLLLQSYHSSLESRKSDSRNRRSQRENKEERTNRLKIVVKDPLEGRVLRKQDRTDMFMKSPVH
ncbi:hypothetical protein DFP72DRAFT_1059331 [Ephemerocybe angulata]|uniref:Uncharacterized protein n=1 Tax=Ephemerocybe angulata TaxID=980116 RepID=A0A8H6MFN4_9AGAR|nr:hypothetical protein DFP72DRAFT_1059331 [Tulosesus angulatus]